MTPTPEMLAMAREVCAEDCDIPEIARNYLKGVRDETREVRIALATITAVTERAAVFVETHAYFSSGPDSGMEPNRHSIDDRHHQTIAKAYRNFDHLKGATPNG